MSRPQRALITGVRGFTGRYLSRELQEHGYDVFGLGNSGSDEAGYFRVDLDDPAALRAAIDQVRPDLVFHLAALAFVAHGNPDDFYQVNVVGTRHLLDAIHASAHRPVKVLVASSANIYGNSSASVLAEETPPAPSNDYAVSKLAMEYMAWLWSDRLPITVVRPFNYTGVGQDENFLLPKIVSHFRKRAAYIELGNIDVSRDFSDVRTFVQLYRRLAESSDAVGGTFNFSSGKSHSLQEVIAMCESLTGHSMEIRINPAFVRPNEVKTLRGDNSRLRSVLGTWNEIELRDTLAWMLDAGQG
ncbi:GDP-mannose 4,6-dehydratase [Pseudoxanthomonas indica]|uniref:Nucleoside-diphosphate-sugar epimerase n=1 Tax=Pseudoxanthomonas indica TaxID=428993 RepID=A0A1T5LFU6_9GAMM|nr:GDP-mannose 4,6-dehydratase [Pseudoxanthomonas indica]GGD34209.1 GDP-6-deoxy-D-lyxo-4-hexulose reductase [Pseudoxanthomonas indica]SKC74258.1 Nucleoside-diphosphate-sugar epimerase [Pseudoxanthomonas indica]